eukprot:Clim_evm2s209 gene=Clim_evmTU2s209
MSDESLAQKPSMGDRVKNIFSRQVDLSNYKVSFNVEEEVHGFMHSLPPNEITTAKYNLFTFLPKNLFEQYQRAANIFFTILFIMMFFSVISPFSPISMGVPLITVLLLTAIKDAYDDVRRHRQDKEVNYRQSLKLVDGQWEPIDWRDIRVGDMLKIENDKPVPADVIILNTSVEDSVCYIDTAELDGETNLKTREAAPIKPKPVEVEDFKGIRMVVTCEPPNHHLYTFNGVCQYNGEDVVTSIDNILLRGCVLRNTEWVYGLVVYAGPETKLMHNNAGARFKRTQLDKEINRIVAMIFIWIILISLGSAIGAYVWADTTNQDLIDFIPFDEDLDSATLTGIGAFFTFFILYNTFIPISLYVTVEFIRGGLSILINVDEDMRDPETGRTANARTTTLNEELGQIEFIFSDKTGTLTQNSMEFKKASVGGRTWGVTSQEVVEREKKEKGLKDIDTADDLADFPVPVGKEDMVHMEAGSNTSVSMSQRNGLGNAVAPSNSRENLLTEERRKSILQEKRINMKDYNPQATEDFECYDEEFVRESLDEDGDPGLANFWTALALCHTVLAQEKENGELQYQASSPDEAALVDAARNFGYKFINRNQEIMKLDVKGKIVEYIPLNLIEFNSDRKRMSVIVRNPEGQVELITKGADSVVLARMSEKARAMNYDTALEHLQIFAADGLRTLAVGRRIVPEAEYKKFAEEFKEASMVMGDRAAAQEEIADKFERNLEYVGCTAIEDKLQDGVPETIALLAKAGIKLWVLTGDKLETAINIGYSCNLLRGGMELFVYSEKTDEQMKEELKKTDQEISGRVFPLPDGTNSQALIIDGHSLLHALQPENKELFLKVSKQMDSVICCRVSPLQKADVVQLVKPTIEGSTLAIGDGANDVSMIRAAHIGVGIAGKEGRQAVLASDYSFGQFRFLQRLLLVHGRWSYIRMCKFLRYFFFKNFAFTMPMFYFAFWNGFSGQSFWDEWVVTLFNTTFTSLPIIMVGVFDQDCDAETSLAYPHLYEAGLRKEFFDRTKFFRSIVRSIYLSLVVYFIPYFLVQEQTTLDNGFPYDYEFWATMTSGLLVMAVNVDLMYETQYWNFYVYLGYFLSMGSWWVLLMLVHAIPPPYVEGFYWMPMIVNGTGIFWLILFVGIPLSTGPTFLMQYYKQVVDPGPNQIAREIMLYGGGVKKKGIGRQIKKKLDDLRVKINGEYTERTGYAFAASEGETNVLRRANRNNKRFQFFRKSKGNNNMGSVSSTGTPMGDGNSTSDLPNASTHPNGVRTQGAASSDDSPQ